MEKSYVFNPEPKTLDELYITWDHWLYLDQQSKEFIEVALSVVLDRDIEGDPVWLYLIAPPGATKTELIRAMSGYYSTYTVDTLTPASFISGLVRRKEGTDEVIYVGGILKNLNRKVLLIKDFTAILSMPDKYRLEIFGQLRTIYDGYLERSFGTIDQPVRVKANMGLIAGVTPIIDYYQTLHSVLGERFLKIRHHLDSGKVAEKAIKMTGQEDEMRRQLQIATKSYLDQLDTKNVPTLTREQEDKILNLALYLAQMRAWVFCHYSSGRIVTMDIAEPEIPGRIVKQLKKLAILLAILRQHKIVTEEEMATIIRVVKDSALPIRRRVVEAVRLETRGTVTDIANTARLHRNTVYNELEKMLMLGIVQRIGKPEKLTDDVDDKGEPRTYYAFTNEFYSLLRGIPED